MARCRVCRRPDVEEIDKEYLSGQTIEELTKKYKFSYWLLSKHFKHIKKEPEEEVDDLATSISLVNQEIKSARARADHKALTSLILAKRDLILAKQKETEVGNSLEARIDAVVQDKELFRGILDRFLNKDRYNKTVDKLNRWGLGAEPLPHVGDN